MTLRTYRTASTLSSLWVDATTASPQRHHNVFPDRLPLWDCSGVCVGIVWECCVVNFERSEQPGTRGFRGECRPYRPPTAPPVKHAARIMCKTICS